MNDFVIVIVLVIIASFFITKKVNEIEAQQMQSAIEREVTIQIQALTEEPRACENNQEA